jgi:hypothetical protein
VDGRDDGRGPGVVGANLVLACHAPRDRQYGFGGEQWQTSRMMHAFQLRRS